jgi:cytochrome o ubiquinol oxidase subunit 2
VKTTKKFLPFMLGGTAVILLLFLLMQPLSILHFRHQIAVLFPKGIVAYEERNLLFIIQALMLLVILPVYILTFLFSWRYNRYHAKSKYDPDLIDNRVAEYIWWGLPCLLTLLVAFLTWRATDRLDPFKPLESDKKPLTIQVIALQWKWLFLYPEEKIAVVNFLQFPKDVPLHFVITADAPMNSFWIPHLGGQIYAMPKMRSELNLIANETGDFRGSSANLSGEGFAGMHFIARASSEEEYRQWLEKARQSANSLDRKTYDLLAKPSTDHPVELFRLKDQELFDQILMKYMVP